MRSSPRSSATPLNSALQHADLLFCNETEACAITGASGAEDAFKKLKDTVPSVVVTNGPHGAYIRHAGVETHVPAFPSEPKDLTGAGDMFAGSFLYGITHGVPPDKAARAASFLSHKVITQVGARLHHGTRQFWDECLASLRRRGRITALDRRPPTILGELCCVTWFSRSTSDTFRRSAPVRASSAPAPDPAA